MWKAIWAAILEFFRKYSKSKNEDNETQVIKNERRLGEINDQVENASNDKLTELAVDSGLVQGSVHSNGSNIRSNDEGGYGTSRSEGRG